MKKINCAVIGMGVGERHANFYKNFNKTNLVKIYEINNNKVKYLKKKFPNVEFVSHESEIYKDKNIDLVSIASYDNFHYKQIINCLKYKKDIFIEKPICLSLKELKEIKRFYKNSKSKISCNLILRGYSKFKKIYQINKQNKFGKIFYIEGDYNYGRIKKITTGWRGKIPFYSVTYGGGVHMIDLITWILNELPFQVKAESNKITTKNSSFKYDDFSVALLKFKSGKIAKISSNFGCMIPHHHSLNIFGSKSTLIHNFKKTSIYKSRNKKVKPEEIKMNFKNKDKNNLLKDFVLNLMGKNKKTLVTFKEILDVMLICFAIEKSFKSNRNVKLDYSSHRIL